MKNSNGIKITQIAVIAAMYAALTYAEGFLIPGSTTAAIQFRVSEALNVLALFTPLAIPGLTFGCIISNLYSIGQGLPLDMIFGSLATLGATTCIYFMRKMKIKHLPLLPMLMPAIWNGIIIGWEIEVFFIDGKFHFASFLVQAGCVALGEFVVSYVLGLPLYKAIAKSKLSLLLRKK
ncbi:MAG: QueT transporter family protein [Clostridiales bacterium]|nr:QueT transporter family protein [Clostridiales bacterium]